MTLLSDKVKRLFDEKAIKRGFFIKAKRGDSSTFRLGLVQDVTPERIRVMYCNPQNGAISNLDIPASEVGAGMWDIFWSPDLDDIFYYGREEKPPVPTE